MKPIVLFPLVAKGQGRIHFWSGFLEILCYFSEFPGLFFVSSTFYINETTQRYFHSLLIINSLQ